MHSKPASPSAKRWPPALRTRGTPQHGRPPSCRTGLLPGLNSGGSAHRTSRRLSTSRKDNMQSLIRLYTRAVALFDSLQSPLLLAIRLYWGWQFATDGWGKLTHLSKVAEYFTSLNLPAPGATALIVALVEFCGGILFAAGLAS